MKWRYLSNIICCLLIGGSIIIGCVLLSETEEETSRITNSPVNSEESTPPLLLTTTEAAELLNMTEVELKFIISHEKKMLSTYGSHSGMMMPFISVQGTPYISKDGLTEWVKQNTEMQNEYVSGKP